jgi:acid phosphatase class B
MMASICFIREETSHGPYFSDEGKAADYLRNAREMSEAQIEKSLAGRCPYINVVTVELDDTSVSFDG